MSDDDHFGRFQRPWLVFGGYGCKAIMLDQKGRDNEGIEEEKRYGTEMVMFSKHNHVGWKNIRLLVKGWLDYNEILLNF